VKYAARSEFGMMYSFNHTQDVVELIKKLKGYGEEYPSRLLSARRISFIELIGRYVMALMRV
jgi:hypothetical protein